MRINNNVPAINTHRQLGISALDGSKSMEKLSSGFRINRAGDDAAGLAISEKMRGQIRGLNMASKNASDTISMIQTAEGALSETHAILQRMRELAVQSANDTNTDADRMELQAEVTQLVSEINRIGNTTEFNTKKLLEGSAKGVSAAVAGTASLNNNSSITADPTSMIKAVGQDNNWQFDGAYMLVKTGQQYDTAGKNKFEYMDYKMVAPNGVVYDFIAAGTTALADEAAMEKLGNVIVGSGTYTATAAESTVTVTLGADSTAVTTLGKGSVLSNASTLQLDNATKLDVNGKIVEVKAGTGGIEVNGTLVAIGSTYVLDDGSVIKADSATVFSVSQGSVKMAADTTSAAISAKADSTIAAGSAYSNLALGPGSVIMGKEATEAGRNAVDGSVKFAAEGVSIQFSRETDVTLTTGFADMKVADSFTFVFSAYQAASSNLADSLMSQIGSNSGQTTFLSIGDMRAAALNVADVDISSKWGAATAIETVNNALQKVSHQRSLLGANQNRLEHTIKNLDVAAENLQAAESRIRDVDMAKEIMEYTKTNILQQASQAMLAQANSAPQSVLALLR